MEVSFYHQCQISNFSVVSSFLDFEFAGCFDLGEQPFFMSLSISTIIVVVYYYYIISIIHFPIFSLLVLHDDAETKCIGNCD